MKWKFMKEEAEERAFEPSISDAPPPLMESQEVHHATARGFWQATALHPAIVATTILMDCMVSAVDVGSLGITAPVLWLIARACSHY